MKHWRSINSNTIVPLLLSLSLLSSCGGSSTTPVVVTPPVVTPPVVTPPVTPPTTLTITALDGYLENAHAYIDLNGNYQFDSGEPEATTNANGVATFSITAVADALLYPVIVEALAGVTIDQNTLTRVAESYTLVAPAGSSVVSPLTTLAQLSLVQQQQPDIEAAIAAVKTQLGLAADSDIMSDYLSGTSANEQLHAIARSIVPLLPENAATVFASGATAATITALFASSGSIATTVLDAIAQGINPRTLFVEVDENGNATATAISQEDAQAFIADIRTWSAQQNGGFLQSATTFSQQLKAAAQIAESDTAELISLMATYSEAAIIAIAADIYHEFDAGLIVSGSTGTVTTSRNLQTHISTAQIDAQFEGKTIITTLTVNTQNISSTTIAAQLESTSTLVIFDVGSQININTDNHKLDSIQLIGSIDNKIDNPTVDPVHFNGLINITITTLINSNGIPIPVPSSMDIAGEFVVNNNESFNALLHVAADPALVDDVVFWSNFQATLQLDAHLANVPDAYVLLDLNRNAGSGNHLAFTLIYGERKLDISTSTNNDMRQITITNGKGITMTVAVVLLQNDDMVGTLTIGAEQIATVSRMDGVYTVTFADGHTEILF